MSPRPRTATPTVFVTARFVRARLVASELVYEPTSEIHGKKMGTTMTMCGQNASSWFKLWDQPFDSRSDRRCAACSAKVFEERRKAL